MGARVGTGALFRGPYKILSRINNILPDGRFRDKIDDPTQGSGS